jgi:hypothetical protein
MAASWSTFIRRFLLRVFIRSVRLQPDPEVWLKPDAISFT